MTGISGRTTADRMALKMYKLILGEMKEAINEYRE